MTTFNIETYLDSLSEQITRLELANKKLTHIPDLCRFKNLTYFYCNNNNLTYLPPLPNSLQYLYCSDNKLSLLPELPQGLCILNCNNNLLQCLPKLPNGLIELHCSYNRLCSIPKLPNGLANLYTNNNKLRYLPLLPKSIKILYCNNNQLISLPRLPSKILLLFCENNRLGSLPLLPVELSGLYFENNPITKTILHNIEKYNRNIRILFRINKITRILMRFRHLYYCLKFRNKFRAWLWEKVREPRIRKQYHYAYLEENLVDEDADLDEVLAKW
jgi:hypothetical protein